MSHAGAADRPGEAPPQLPARWTSRPAGLFEEEGGRLVPRASRCTRCGKSFFPARTFCPVCRRGDALAQARLSGRGSVHTFSVVRQSTPEFPVPYTVAYADLDEGIRLLGQIDGCPPGAVRIGMEIEVVPVATGTDLEGRTVFTYRFRPASAPGASREQRRQ